MNILVPPQRRRQPKFGLEADDSNQYSSKLSTGKPRTFFLIYRITIMFMIVAKTIKVHMKEFSFFHQKLAVLRRVK